MVENILLSDEGMFLQIVCEGKIINRLGHFPDRFDMGLLELCHSIEPQEGDAYLATVFTRGVMTFDEAGWRLYHRALQIASAEAEKRGVSVEDKTQYSGQINPYIS